MGEAALGSEPVRVVADADWQSTGGVRPEREERPGRAAARWVSVASWRLSWRASMARVFARWATDRRASLSAWVGP